MCANAVFAVQTAINLFIANDSSVFVASSDLSKAFDRVNHFKLYNSLLSKGIPVYIATILVRWNDCLFSGFAIGSNVRQGSVLSAAI